MSPTRIRRPVLRVLSIAVLAATLAACSPSSDTVELTGRVSLDEVAIGAPALPVAAPDVGAGTRISAPSARASRSEESTITQLGREMMIASVDVQVGDRVDVGETVATIDDRALVAQVEAARASRRGALAQVDVLDTRLDEIADARAEIADQRASVLGSLANARATRAELSGRLAQARQQLAELEAARRRLESLPAPPSSLPSTVPPGFSPPSPPPGTPNPAELDTGIARLRSAIAQLEQALARIDGGIAQANAGLSRLATARTDTADARDALQSARDLAYVVAKGTRVGVDLAEHQRSLAVITSPVTGVVVEAAHAGEVVVPGAPVVVVRPEAGSSANGWVNPRDVDSIAVGTAASVRLDSVPGTRFPATVSSIGTSAEFPPTYVATREYNLGRAVSVTVTLDDTATALPQGTPVDIDIERTEQ